MGEWVHSILDTLASSPSLLGGREPSQAWIYPSRKKPPRLTRMATCPRVLLHGMVALSVSPYFEEWEGAGQFSPQFWATGLFQERIQEEDKVASLPPCLQAIWFPGPEEKTEPRIYSYYQVSYEATEIPLPLHLNMQPGFVPLLPRRREHHTHLGLLWAGSLLRVMGQARLLCHLLDAMARG